MIWTLFTFWIIFLLRVLITQRLSTCDQLTVSASVSTMAGQQIRMLKPVYLRNRDIQCKKDAQITDYALAGAVGSKITDIKCIQRDRDLWRIYVDSRESRNLLVAEGFELGNRTISVFDTNPFSAGTEKPDEEVLRVTVKGVPLSVEDSCIVNMLEKLGAKLTSDVKYEKIRNPTTKKMTDILNGNRFVYIQPLDDGSSHVPDYGPLFDQFGPLLTSLNRLKPV